jgi:hypothetical protein
MIATVWVVTVTLNLSGRNQEPLSVLSTPGENIFALDFDLGRVAVHRVAAGLCRVIRHKPGRVELLMNRLVRGRMMVLLCPSLGEDLREDYCCARSRYDCDLPHRTLYRGTDRRQSIHE